YQMKFGSLIHRILQRVDEGKITTLDAALDEFRKEFLEHHKDDYPSVVFARTYWTGGLRMLRRWWATERAQGKVLAVEYSFDDLVFNGHTIRGRIDRISDEDGLVLTDYKTSASMAEIEDAQRSLQLAIYYLAATTRPDLTKYGKPVVRMQLVYPGVPHTDWDTMEVRCGKRVQTPEDAKKTLEDLKDILRRAADEEFDPSPTADCRWCEMRPLCPRHPEGHEVPR
ncbi:MAG: PD-(D/E)XK nuclease family protein, partial [Actinomycetota bacterium]